MGTNSIKVSSHWESEQHHGAPWKPNKECIWANHFGVSLREKPRYLLLGMTGVQGWGCDHLPWEADRQCFFMLRGILYLGLYHLFGIVLGLYHLRYAFASISAKAVWKTLTCDCSVRAYITHWEQTAASELFPWALDALQTTMLCALFQWIWLIVVGSSVFAGWQQCWVNMGRPIYVYGPMFAKIVSDVYDYTINFQHQWKKVVYISSMADKYKSCCTCVLSKLPASMKWVGRKLSKLASI